MEGEKQIVAMDFLGLGNFAGTHHSEAAKMDGFHSHLCKTSSSPEKKKEKRYEKLMDGTFLRNRALGGVKHHNMWSKPSMMQYPMPYMNSQEERFIEQSAENFPDGSNLHLNRRKQGMDSCSQPIEDFAPPIHFPSKAIGMMPKGMPPPKVDMDLSGGASVRLESRMHLTEPKEKEVNAPLTIFYGGNVNVFNDISAQQAYEIMLLASGITPNCGPIDFSNLVANRDITNALTQKSNANLSSEHTVMATFQATVNQVANRACFAYPNMSLPSISLPEVQLEVPRALPQARKASLARFLEKRRERLLMKSPYPLKQDNSYYEEERLSSSNDAIA